MIDIYKKNSEKTETELSLEALNRIRDERVKKEREAAYKAAPNNLARSQMKLDDIVRKRLETTARAQDIQKAITQHNVANALDFGKMKDAYAASIPVGPPEKPPSALQKLKTNAEYLSAKTGAGISEGLASAADTVGSLASGVKNVFSNVSSNPQMTPLEMIQLTREGRQGYLASGKAQLDEVNKINQRVDKDFTYAGGQHNAVLDFLADAGYQMGRMAPTIYVSAFTSAAGAPSLASKIAGAATISATSNTSAVKRAREEGATPQQAESYGLLSGAIEGVGEYAIGGLFGKGAGLLDTGLQKLGINFFKNLTNPVVKPIARYLTGAAGEGVEEMIQEVLDVAAQKATYKKDAKYDVGEILYAGGLGAFMGAVGSLPNSISSTKSGADSIKYVKGVVESVKNARTEQDFAGAAEYIAEQIKINNNLVEAINNNKTYDSDVKEAAAAPYVWMNSELEKALGIMASRQNEIINANKEEAYKGTTPEDVTPAVDSLHADKKNKEAVDTIIEAVRSNNAIKNEIDADSALGQSEKKKKVDGINESNKKLSETASDIRNNRYTPNTEKPKTGFEENISEYNEYLDESQAAEAELETKKTETGTEQPPPIETAQENVPSETLTKQDEAPKIESEQPAAEPAVAAQPTPESKQPEPEAVPAETTALKPAEVTETKPEETAQSDKKFNLTLVNEKHTRTGEDLIVARVDKYLKNDEYKELKKLMEGAGAYYSQTKRGFILKNPSDRAKLGEFANVTEANQATPPQPASAAIKDTETEANQAPPVKAAEAEMNEESQSTKEQDSSKIRNNEQESPIQAKTDYSENANTAADKFAEMLSGGEAITRAVATRITSESHGGTLANNDFTVKDVNDAIELGVNKYILGMDKTSPEYSVDGLVELTSRLPTQTNRTAEQEAFQQFSTPPALAYVVADVANIDDGDIVLEPSAGIGGIAIFAKKQDATVHVNELDKRRLSLIKQLPFDGFFNEDAEQIHNILSDKIKPSVIVMNPPFSSAAGRNVKSGNIGAKHIEAALNLLEDSGRLVAITGRGMNDSAPAFSKWWGDIKKQYNVRANIGLDGKNYSKYGTAFDVQVMVIDKNGATAGDVLTGTAATVQELQERLEGVKNERRPILRKSSGQNEISQEVQRDENKPTRAEAPESTESGVRTDIPVSEPAPVVGAEDTANRAEQPDSAELDRGDGVSIPGGNANESIIGESDDRRGQAGSDRDIGGSGDAGRPVDGSGILSTDGGKPNAEDSGRLTPELETATEKRTIKPKKELTDSLFDTYTPSSLSIKGVKPHPTKVAESAAMSAISAPPLTYVPSLPKKLIEGGVLSDVQVEAVSYAGQAHSQTLPNGSAKGFFIGDGTGLGKGREISGIILDSFNRGQKKALWISENAGLLPDAKRDIKALFETDEQVFAYEGGQKAAKILKRADGIMFATYGALAKGFQQQAPNLNNIVNWLGEDFDGVIVFDESHNMANAGGDKTARGIKKPSNASLAGIELQKRLPKAKIVYSSATGATEVSNLRYAERLGLWGTGTPFVDGNDFARKINQSGIAAMEVVARSLKAMGVYVSRNLSYDGVEYSRVSHNLTSEQKKVYDDLAGAWSIIAQNVGKALEITNGKGGSAYSAFWGAQQRFFNQIITSMQTPALIENIEQDLANDKSVLIQLTSTNEAHAKRELAAIQERDGELDEFDATPKGMVISYLENSFPVEQYETVVDENGNATLQLVTDSEGKPVINKQAVAMRDELIQKISASLYPDSPIDMIINHFGTNLVAENTGRSFRMIKDDKGNVSMQTLPSDKSADVDAFQNGNKRIIIFSEAGGTGKSYHADKTAKNQQRRRHYLLQPGWKADTAVQGFGRSHRSNQASAPELVLMATDLPGQKRFVSTIARRLDQLGALTKGQAQAGSQGLFKASDNLENPLVGAVLENLYRVLATSNPTVLDRMGLLSSITDQNGKIVESADLRNVNKFLNRIFMLDFDTQTQVFGTFEEMIESATQTAIEAGVYQQGMANYKADRVEVADTAEIESNTYGGIGASYHHLKAYNKLNPLKYEDIDRASSRYKGIYQSARTGKIYAAYTAPDNTDKYGNVVKAYRMIDVKNTRKTIAAKTADNPASYTMFTDAAAEKAAWKAAIEKLPSETEVDVHVIGGEMLSVWDRLPDENVKINRFLTSDGEQIIGRVIDEGQIAGTLQRIGIKREKGVITSDRAINALAQGGAVRLVNGWEISPRRVANETRYEISGSATRGKSVYGIEAIAKQYGLFTEKIGWETRLFVPSGEKAQSTIENIVKYYPIDSLSTDTADASDGIGSYGTSGKRYSFASGDTVGAAGLYSGERHYSELVKNIANKRGVSVVVDNDIGIGANGETINAYYDRATKTIHINPLSDKPATALLAHEVFHSLAPSEQYRLAEFFRAEAADSKDFATFKKARMEAYNALYDKAGQKFTERDFWNEFAAENVETLMTNEAYAAKLAETDRGLLRRILDFVRKLWHSITGGGMYSNTEATEAANISAQALSKAEKMFADALKVDSWELSGEVKQAGAADTNADAVGYSDIYRELYSIESPPTQAPTDFGAERTNEELAALFESDRVITKGGGIRAWFASAGETIANLSRVIADIPEHGPQATRFAQFRNDIINYRYHSARSSDRAIRLMQGMLKYRTEAGREAALTNEEYKVFEKAVYYRDLKEEAELQLARGAQDIALPHGMTLSEVTKQLNSLNITDNVQKSLDNRAKVWQEATNNYIEANAKIGFNVAERFTRQNYYHHQVIKYMSDKKGGGKRAVEINDNRAWLKRRIGSELSINTNFVSVEYTALQQILYDTYVAQTLGSIKESYDIKPQLVERAKGMNKQAINDVIIEEATQAAVKAEEERLGRKLTATERSGIAPLSTISKSGKVAYDSVTYRDIATFNRNIAHALNNLQNMAEGGVFDAPIGESGFGAAVDDLKAGLLNSDVYKFISSLTTSENEKARIAALTFLKNNSLKQQYTRKRLGDGFMTWEKLIEDTDYTIVQPREGNHFFVKDMVDTENLTKVLAAVSLDMAQSAEALGDRALELITEYTEHIKMMGQPYEQWAVPSLVKTVMDRTALKKQPGKIAQGIKSVMAFWKGWVTSANPLSTVKYGVRNLVGDFDAVMTGNPGIAKQIPRAVGEIRDAMYKNIESADFMEWAEMGGETNIRFVQEITEGNMDKLFTSLKTSNNAGDVLKSIPQGYFKHINGLHNFREMILRYSSYLYYKDKISASGGKISDYVASNRDIIKGLKNDALKAYQLSSDLLGNYAEISEGGRALRSFAIPFYSFIETNAKRYFRMLVNPWVSIAHKEEVGKNATRFVVRGAAMCALTATLHVINQVINKDDDDKLPESVKNRPHLTLFSIGDNVFAFTRLGNMLDLLEWVGLDDGEFDFEEDKWAPVDKLLSSANPFIKGAAELAFGVTTYPTAASLKPIRDKGYYTANIFGAASVYNEVTGKPTKGNVLDLLTGAFVYKYDQKESAYWDTINAKYNFADKDSRNIYFPDDKSKALHYMKQAMRYGETNKALKFLDDYFEAGGTGNGFEKSMQRLDPMYGYKSDDKKGEWQEFKNSLDEAGYNKLRAAFDYYEDYLKLPDNIIKVLRRYKDTPADNKKAKIILTNHINAMSNKTK